MMQIATVNGSAVALGGGYFWNSGFNARAFYRLNETWGDYSDGSGFQADMGYMLNMTAGFHIGFLLSHRQVTFSKNNTITNFNSTTKKDTQPMITIGWLIN